MPAAVVGDEREVRRLKALIAGFVTRTRRVLPSSGDDPVAEILDLHHWSDYVQREIELPAVPLGLCYLDDARVVHATMSVEERPH